MTIEEGLRQLKNYVEVKRERLENKNDDNFEAFSDCVNSLNAFVDKYKSIYNINNEEEFHKLLMEEVSKQSKNNTLEPINELYAMTGFGLAYEVSNKGFIDFEKFYDIFSAHLKDIQENKFQSKLKDILQEQNRQEQLKQDDENLQNEILQESKAKEEQIIEEELKIQREKELEDSRLDTSDLEAEVIGQINEISASLANSSYLTQDNMHIREEIGNLEKLQTTDDFAMPNENRDTTKKDFAIAEINSEHRISPDQMLNFINDTTQIQFPFSAENTINDKKFLKEFHRELKGKSTQELQQLIDNMRAKNDALRQEIAELNDKKRKLMEALKNETINNSKLTAIQNQELKDSERDFQKTNKEREIDLKEAKDKEEKAKQEDLQRNRYRKKKI